MDKKKLDTRQSVTVSTKNTFVKAEGLATLSTKARKLLYTIIAQSQKGDDSFYTYKTTALELSKLWGVSNKDIYRDLDAVVSQLMAIYIRVDAGDIVSWRHLVKSGTEYNKKTKVLTIGLHEDMRDLILGIEKGGNFAKPPLWDFMRMRSKYGMALWHYISAEMKSGGAPIGVAQQYDIEIDLETLRRITGTEKKLKQIKELRTCAIEVAIRDIEHNALARIEYDAVREGRYVTGFVFHVQNALGHIDPESLTLRERQRARKAELLRKKSTRRLTQKEDDELQALIVELDQMSMEDFL